VEAGPSPTEGTACEPNAETPRLGFRRFQPLDRRISLHEEVLALRGGARTYRQIADEIELKFGIRLSKSTISDWTSRKASPLRAGHPFVARPTPELAYVIGVEAGDGFLNVKPRSYQYRIRLRAVDREFVEEFNQAVSKVLGCPPHRLWKGEKTRETEVEFGSYSLHKFLMQKLDDLKPFIEHDKSCAAAFIRGFFDSEGCVEVSGKISGANTDLSLLTYAQELLHRFFHIETRGPYRGKMKGTILTRRGKSYVRNADCYSIYVVMQCAGLFYNEIGLTIERKKIRLETALGLS
jgi:hypothetical protein